MGAAGLVSALIVGCADTYPSWNPFAAPEVAPSPEAAATAAITSASPAVATTPVQGSVAALPHGQVRIPSHGAGHAAKVGPGKESKVTASKETGSQVEEGTADSSETPRSVVTLGEPSDANAATVAPSPATASVSPAAVPTLAMAAPDISLRDKTGQLMRDVNGDAKQVDEKNLTPEQVSRETLAKRLINSAQRSIDDNDYSAANSLATKASALLRSLPRIESSSSTR